MIQTSLFRHCLALSALLIPTIGICQQHNVFFDYDRGNDVGKKVLADREGNIYVAGTVESKGIIIHDGKDFALAKYHIDEVTGVLVEMWRKFYDGPAAGMDSDDYVTGLAISNEGIPYVSGYSKGANGGYDVAVIAFNPVSGLPIWPGNGGDFHNGAARWTSSGNDDDRAFDMAIDVNGNLILCGDTANESTEPAFASADALIVVFRPDGVRKLVKWYGTTTNNELFNAVAVDGSSRFATAGYTILKSGESGSQVHTRDAFVMMHSGSGIPLMEEILDEDGLEDEALDVTFINGNTVATCGYVTHDDPTTDKRWYTVWRLSITSDPVLTHTQYESRGSRASAITYSDELVYVTGLFEADKLMTAKLNQNNFSYSTSWQDLSQGGTLGVGRRLTFCGVNGAAEAIWFAGTNVYITGNASFASATETFNAYLTDSFRVAGENRVPDFPDLFPDNPKADTYANALTIFAQAGCW
jgi:hypothetical protein